MIRLIVTDMDGTLLHDHATSVNPQYFEAIREMKKRNILFCVASGRQYESLRTLFAPVKDDILMAQRSCIRINVYFPCPCLWKYPGNW